MLSRENEVIARIGRIINSTLDIEEVYERFAEEVHKLIPFHRIAINLLNRKDGNVTIAYVSGVEVPGRRRGDIVPHPVRQAGRSYEPKRAGSSKGKHKSSSRSKYPGFCLLTERGSDR
jgi:hypothetical protein